MERRKNYFIVVKIMIFVICMAMGQTHVLAAQKLKVTASRTVVIGETIKLKTNIRRVFGSDPNVESIVL